jgi:hypothetical protein
VKRIRIDAREEEKENRMERRKEPSRLESVIENTDWWDKE